MANTPSKINFFKKIRLSIYGPQFYKQISESNLNAGLIYFLFLCLILAAITTLSTMIQMVIVGTPLAKAASTIYPKELIIKVHKGTLSTNMSQPYVIPLPKDFNDTHNLAVINTKTPYDQSEFTKYNAEIVFTKDSFYFKKNDVEIREYKLSNIDNLIINKGEINSIISKITLYLPLIIFAISVFLYAIFLITFLFNLFAIFILALLIWLFSKWLVSKKLTYKQSYIVGLYAATAGLIFNTILAIIAPQVKIPFTMTIIGLILYLLNVKSLPSTQRNK